MAALHAVPSHKCKSITTDVIQHPNLKRGRTKRFDVAFMNQVYLILSLGYNFRMDDPGLQAINC